jgi:hypothetical protein
MNLKKSSSGCCSPMRSNTSRITGIAVVLAGMICACSAALYIPKEGPGTTKEEIREMNIGRAAYIKKCASCHTLYLPDKYDVPNWNIRVKGMSERARLTKEEERQVIMYLTRNGR